MGSILGQGTYLGCWFNLWSGCIQEGNLTLLVMWMFLSSSLSLSLSLSFPLFLSLKAIEKVPWVRIKEEIYMQEIEYNSQNIYCTLQNVYVVVILGFGIDL